MRVLIDAVHPADVWTLGAVEDRLLANGEETLWVSRPEKDSVVELIEAGTDDDGDVIYEEGATVAGGPNCADNNDAVKRLKSSCVHCSVG